MDFFFGSHVSKAAPKLTLSQFKDLYDQLLSLQGGAVHEEEALREILRKISEMIVYGEKDESMFDYFCEKNILSKFVDIVNTSSSSEVKTQVIQTMCIIIQNMKNKTSLYFVLSGNHINKLINYAYDFSDEELRANFISLLRALTLKLNPETVQFFLDPRIRPPPFHLYTRALEFVSSPDPMSRTSALNMILHIFQVEDEPLQSFLRLEGHQQRFFAELCRALVSSTTRLNSSMEPASTAKQATLDRLMDEILGMQDQLYYLEDMLATGEKLLATQLRSYFIENFFYPVLLEGLSAGGAPAPTERASAQVALFLLAQFFAILQKSKSCVHFALRALLHPDCFSLDRLDCLDKKEQTSDQDGGSLNVSSTSSAKNTLQDGKPQNPYRAKLIQCISGQFDYVRRLAIQALKSILENGAASKECLAEMRVIPLETDHDESEIETSQELVAALLDCMQLCDPWPSLDVLRMVAEMVLTILEQYDLNEKRHQRLKAKLDSVQAKTASTMMQKLVGPLGDLFINVLEDEMEAFLAVGPLEKIAVTAFNTAERRRSQFSNSDSQERNTEGLKKVNSLGMQGVTFGSTGMVLANPKLLLIPDSEDSETDQVEAAKRSIQAFLLVRTVHRSVIQTPEDINALAGTPHQRMSILLGDTLASLGRRSPLISAGSSMVLSGRECLACTVPAEISQGEQTQRQSVQSKAAIGTDQLYLVLDEDLLLLATPDRWRLEAGLIKSCAWIHHVDCAVDRVNVRKLHLAARSSSPVGLMWPEQREQRSKRWKLILLFENERNCQIAMQHIEKNRIRLRLLKMNQISEVLLQVGANEINGTS